MISYYLTNLIFLNVLIKKLHFNINNLMMELKKHDRQLESAQDNIDFISGKVIHHYSGHYQTP